MTAHSSALVLGEINFPFHRFEEKKSEFEAILGDVCSVVTTTDRAELAGLPDSEYYVVVDYLTDSTLSSKQLEGLLTFVEAGGGYVPVHCGGDLTSTSNGCGGINHRDDPFPALRKLVGGHFLNHPEQSEFGIELVADHPVTEGVSDFRIFDEPYRVAWDNDLTVLARMDHPDLDAYPVLWVKTYGSGRVCYLSLGHTDDAFEHESFRTILRNAVRWTSNRPTTAE